MSIWLLEYEICNGEHCERTYAGVFTTELEARQAFDKLLDKKLLEGEDAVNEWQPAGDGRQEFRTGAWGFHVWKLREMELNEVGEVETPSWEWPTSEEEVTDG
jgi:hypothetical protein